MAEEPEALLPETEVVLWLPGRFCCGSVWPSTPSNEAELEPEVDRRGPDGGPLADTGLDTCSEAPSGDGYPAGGDRMDASQSDGKTLFISINTLISITLYTIQFVSKQLYSNNRKMIQ